MTKELEKTKRKTPLEMFKEIKELEVADSPLMTVEDCLPFMCKKVEQALLKAQKLEKVWKIVQEKNVDMWFLKQTHTVDQYNNLYNRNNMSLTEEEYELLKEMSE